MQKIKILNHPTLIYTFRTNKNIDTFAHKGINVFVFGKLTLDFKKFQELIHKTQPQFIIGIAEVETITRIETLTINKFGSKGLINKNGAEKYSLHTPKESLFPLSAQPTNSFCNWVMYKTAEAMHKTKVPTSFIHYNSSDLGTVIDYLQKLKTYE